MQSRGERVNGRPCNHKKIHRPVRPVDSSLTVAILAVAFTSRRGDAHDSAARSIGSYRHSNRAVAVVGGSAVIGRPAVVVAIAVVIVVAAVLGGRDRNARTDDAGERRRSRGTAATAIVPAARADIGRVAGPGRSRDALGLTSRSRRRPSTAGLPSAPPPRPSPPRRRGRSMKTHPFAQTSRHPPWELAWTGLR